ncbi:MAG: hypothetical protein U0271_45010 [Polyangiaceae bacterium]
MRQVFVAPVTCAVAVLLVACSSEVIQGGGGSGGSPSGGSSMNGGAGGDGDHEPPRVTLEAPTPGLVTNQQSVVVVGKATDASAIESVTVDGYPAISDDGFATFSAEVPVSLGENYIGVSARDVLGNEDPEAASVVVWGVDDSPPKIDEVFPGVNIAIDGPTVPVRVFASSPAGIADVRVNGVSGVAADGGWLFEDVLTNQWALIEAEDPFGNLTYTPYLPAAHPTVSPFWQFSATEDGRLVGFDRKRRAIAVFDPNAPQPYTAISDSTLGSGPGLPESSEFPTRVLFDVTWTDQGISLGAEAAAGSGELIGYRIDPATGDRTVTQSCFLGASITAIATDGDLFYATTELGLFACDPVSGDAAFMTPLPLLGMMLEYDAIHDRLIVSGYDLNSQLPPSLTAVDRLSGDLTPLIPAIDDGLWGFTVVDGEIYLVDAFGLEHWSESGGFELVIPGATTGVFMAACPAGGGPAFCLTPVYDIERWVLGPSGWIVAPIAQSYGAGSGPMPAESASIALVDGPVPPFALGGANPTVLTSLDGVRTPTALSAGSELRVLAGGVGVAAEGGVFTRFQASADGVSTISVVPGPAVTTLSAFELAPANTWDVEPVIVYLTPTELRYRTLSGGDQLLATVANGNGLAVTQDGVVYVSTLLEGVTSLMTVEHGQPSSTIGGLPVSLAGMVYDRQRSALVTPAIDIVSLPDLTVKHFDPASFEPPAATLTSIRPGPFAGTYWAVLGGRDWALVDVDHARVFTVAR